MSKRGLAESGSNPIEDRNASNTVRSELTRLAIRAFLVSVIAWLSIYLFETYFAEGLGIQHFHIQITASVATIAISLPVINSIRGIIRRLASRISAHIASTITFFAIVMISLFATLSLFNQWNIDPQTIFVGGGVTAVIIGIALSTIVGNILSGGLVLTTFPAKIGDSILIVNDNLRGKIDEVNLLYTKILTDQGSEYFVPNNAVIQGNIRLIKERLAKETDDLPFVAGDSIELTGVSGSYAGKVNKVTSRFISLISNLDGDIKEVWIPRNPILDGQYVVVIRHNNAPSP